MKRTKVGLVIISALATLGVAPSSLAVPLEKAPGQKEERPDKLAPFHGKVKAVDPNGRMLGVDDQIIHITKATKLTKNGKAIELSDLMVGEEVHGMTRLTFDGKPEAVTVKVGPPPKKDEKVPEKR